MSEPALKPDVRAFLDALKANPRPAMNDAMIAMIRQIPAGSMPSPDLPVGELGAVRDVAMAGPGGAIRMRLYDPRAERAPGPVVVFYHGGGFVVGGIETHAGLAAELARGLDLPVVSVDYRLAPEHTWPAAQDDAEAAARWIAENGAAFGRSFTGLILCGDSAGGNLCLVTALALRDAPAALPVVMQLPIYPGTDRSVVRASRQAFSEGLGLDGTEMAYFDSAFAADRQHWRNSPLLADLAGLPPTLLVTAEYDPLRDEGRAFAAKAIEAGVDVTYIEARGTIHGFATYRLTIPSAREDLAAVIRAAKAMLGAMLN
jgi:acetyl esterase